MSDDGTSAAPPVNEPPSPNHTPSSPTDAGAGDDSDSVASNITQPSPPPPPTTTTAGTAITQNISPQSTRILELEQKISRLEQMDRDNREEIVRLRKELQERDNHSVTSADINYWTKPRIDTVSNWNDSCNEIEFIYGRVLDNAKIHLERVQIWTMIIASIDSIISFLQLAINDTDHPEYSFVFKILLTVSSVITTVITSWSAIKKFSQKVQDYSKYTEQLSNFSSKTISELSLTNDLRVNAVEFIKNNKDKYQSLMRDCPEISQAEFVAGKKSYNQFLEDGNEHCKLFGKIKMKKDVASAAATEMDFNPHNSIEVVVDYQKKTQ